MASYTIPTYSWDQPQSGEKSALGIDCWNKMIELLSGPKGKLVSYQDMSQKAVEDSRQFIHPWRVNTEM